MTNWQTKTIGDLVNYEQPSKYLVGSTDYTDKGTPVLTANKAFVLGCTEETNGIYRANKDSPVIIFDDFTTDCKFVDFDFKVKSSAIKILTAKPNEALPKFVHGAMQLIKTEITEHKRHFISEYQFNPVDVPLLSEQKRIVGVLEVWDEYIKKLEQKIALKEQLKKGLMQQLLTGRRRPPGFNSPLATREFKGVFDTMSKHPGHKSSEYSISGEYPIYDQSYDKHISGYTDDEDKLINPGQSIVLFGDHSRVVKYINSESFAVGNDGIKLFRTRDDIDDYYAYLLLKCYKVPNTGYNRHFKYIADATFDIPELAEQKYISSLIKTADDETRALQKKIKQLKSQKKYLLKNLITGTIRTPENLKPKGASS